MLSILSCVVDKETVSGLHVSERKIISILALYKDVTIMLLRSQSISYFNVKRTIWLKGYQNGNRIKPLEQRLQETSIAKN